MPELHHFGPVLPADAAGVPGSSHSSLFVTATAGQRYEYSSTKIRANRSRLSCAVCRRLFSSFHRGGAGRLAGPGGDTERRLGPQRPPSTARGSHPLPAACGLALRPLVQELVGNLSHVQSHLQGYACNSTSLPPPFYRRPARPPSFPSVLALPPAGLPAPPPPPHTHSRGGMPHSQKYWCSMASRAVSRSWWS